MFEAVRQDRFITSMIFLLSLLSGWGGQMTTAAPPHDECANAIFVAAGDPNSGSTVGATGFDQSSCADDDFRDVWFRYVPSVTGQIQISLCGSTFDTTLAVYTGCGGVELACNDDSCDLQSEVLVSLTAGVEYIIRVAGYGGETGDYILTITEGIQPPANDHCADAIEVSEGEVYLGTTSLSTGTDVSSCGDEDTQDVWHLFIPPETEDYRISLAGSSFDTTLAVYTSCVGGEIGCNDDSIGYQSELILPLTQDVPYFIRISGYGGETGAYVLEVESACPEPVVPFAPAPPDLQSEVPREVILSWNEALVPPEVKLKGTTPKVIYGQDDRREEYEVVDPSLLNAGDATCALLPLSSLTNPGDGTYLLDDETFAEYILYGYGEALCADEPFGNQPNPAFCSGFLVSPDVVATAGHCITNPAECADSAYVFGFVMLEPNMPALVIDESEVYFCQEIILRQQSAADWGLIRLDRPVVGHTPLPVRRSGKIGDSQDVAVIGHPVGLPRKYAGGARVRDNTPSEYFQANLDTYGGNSGSTVLNTDTWEVEGILVRGQADFVEQGGCIRSHVCTDDPGCPGWEDVTRATEFSHLIQVYDVYFGENPDQLNLLCEDTNVPWCNAGTLICGKTYYWQVVAKDNCHNLVGPLWSFTVQPTGDLDANCVVNIHDYARFAPSWQDLNCTAENSWCDDADLNKDGKVNVVDTYLLTLHWLDDVN